MGKIRVKTLGDESLERQQKKEAKKRQEVKKTVKAPGLKGGERVMAVGPTEEELAKLESAPVIAILSLPKEKQSKNEEIATLRRAQGKLPRNDKKRKTLLIKKRERSKGYKTALMQVDRNKTYLIAEALDILPKIGLAKFDETVELHINTTESGISGNLNLPHGAGKKTRVAIADEKLIAELEKGLPAGRQGKIDFDVLIATPAMMPKLVKIAKVLSSKGLMPNPKTGTITNNPEDVVKKFASGQVHFKTEAKTPIIHLTVGKVSFGKDKLMENIKSAISTIQTIRIRKAVLKSTMSPGIKLDTAKIA